ncbi:MAG: DUF4974 domain-containing protein [Cyclobacteriaceae bacterium]
MHEQFEISNIIYAKLSGNITAAQSAKLDRWLAESGENKILFEKIANPTNQLNKIDGYRQFDEQKIWDNLEDELFDEKVVRFDFRTVLKYAAAVLLPLLAISYYFLSINSSETLSPYAQLDQIAEPGSNSAILKLADGTSHQVSSSPFELFESNTRIANTDVLTYTPSLSHVEVKEVYHELITPTGGNYQVTLSDGTNVWLNAASKLRFPVNFSDSVRQVHLEGEGFFEVAHASKPFIVSSDRMEVSVLGTQFNISAYENDAEHLAVLAEGKIGLQTKTSGQMTIMNPNEKATVNASGQPMITIVDAERYTSWRNGKFEFQNTSLETVMEKLARWYGIAYVFENEQARLYHFTARIDNSQNISSILEMLTLSTDVEFDIDGATIVIR